MQDTHKTAGADAPRDSFYLRWSDDGSAEQYSIKLMGELTDGSSYKTVFSSNCEAAIPKEWINPGAPYKALVREYVDEKPSRTVINEWFNSGHADEQGVIILSDKKAIVASAWHRMYSAASHATLADLTVADDNPATSILPTLVKCMRKSIATLRDSNCSDLPDFAAARQMLKQIEDRRDPSFFAREALRYIVLHEGIVNVFAAVKCKRYTSPGFRNKVAEATINAITSDPAFHDDSPSSNFLLAKAESLRHREGAARLFITARNLDPTFFDAMAMHGWSIHGASTYFDEAEISAARESLPSRYDECVSSHRYIGSPSCPSACTILIGCDPQYFRIFASYWFNVLPVLHSQGVAVHFLLTGETDECGSVIESGEAIRSALERLHGYSTEDFVSYSMIPIPSFVQCKRTFYACSRYVLLRKLAADLQTPLWVSDIDLEIVSDVAPFIDSVDRAKFGVLPNHGIACLAPWVRFIANTFWFPQGSEDADRYSANIEEYILYGLGHIPSRGPSPKRWFLDQNALDYAFDQMTEDERQNLLYDLRQRPRPTLRSDILQTMRELHLASTTKRQPGVLDSLWKWLYRRP